MLIWLDHCAHRCPQTYGLSSAPELGPFLLACARTVSRKGVEIVGVSEARAVAAQSGRQLRPYPMMSNATVAAIKTKNPVTAVPTQILSNTTMLPSQRQRHTPTTKNNGYAPLNILSHSRHKGREI
jgi:hypothetical protein